MKIEKRIADAKHYGDKRSTKDIKYIVIQNITNKPVSHYNIINGEAIQIIPDDHIGNSVSGPRLNRRGYLHGVCTKYNSVSIGVPCKLSDSDKQMCFNLIMTIKQRYKINDDDIIRQMDVTGEMDPETWHDSDSWNKDIKNKLIDI